MNRHRERRLGTILVAAGTVRVLAGLSAWCVVRAQLTKEHIVVPDSARWFARRKVRGPLTAFAEADAIRAITAGIAGDRPYAEFAEDDPMGETVRTAAFLRSSLLCSVLAFGMAIAEIATGLSTIVGACMARSETN